MIHSGIILGLLFRVFGGVFSVRSAVSFGARAQYISGGSRGGTLTIAGGVRVCTDASVFRIGCVVGIPARARRSYLTYFLQPRMRGGTYAIVRDVRVRTADDVGCGVCIPARARFFFVPHVCLQPRMRARGGDMLLRRCASAGSVIGDGGTGPEVDWS
jgi:hypothetical protein